jgi:hypothetical protein
VKHAIALFALTACRADLVVGAGPPDAPPLLPNLALIATETSPVYVQDMYFDPDACELGEGCIGAAGNRRLLRFNDVTANLGQADLELGATPPAGVSSGVFVWSPCHQHHHVAGFEDYALVGAAGTIVAGHKQAFCLRDDLRERAGVGPQRFDCTDQGISAGWADVYQPQLACQWIDVTGVPPGAYTVRVTVNPTRAFAESDYDDDVLEFSVLI